MSIRTLHLALMVVLGIAATARMQADDVDDYINARLGEFHLPALSLAVVKDGRVVKAAGYGVMDRSRQTPATAETLFKIGSVSKQFIASAVMLLAQDGKLSVDAPLATYIEDIPSAWRAITVRHLLVHTAGLVRESPGFDPMKAMPDIEVIRAAYSVPLLSVPGSKYAYSNAGYYVLAEIITRVSGRPWTRFVDERIFAPVRMAVTVSTTISPIPPARAVGYSGKDNKAVADEWLALRPSGAFISNVIDLAKWDAALDGTTILSASSRGQMWAPARLNDGTSVPYGFGWHVESFLNRPVVWHGGGIPGFSSRYTRFVDDHLSIILLTNGDDVDLGGITAHLSQTYLRAAVAR